MEIWVYWLIAAGVLLIIEMFSLTLYMLWLAIGALAAMVVSIFVPTDIVWQVVTGVVIAGILTLFTKPLTRKFRHAKGFEDAGINIIQERGTVLEAIEPGQIGIVKVGSEMWSATALASIAVGSEVIVVRRSSTIVEVEQWRGEM